MSVKTYFVKVLRPIMVGGEMTKVGDVVELVEREVKELLHREAVELHGADTDGLEAESDTDVGTAKNSAAATKKEAATVDATGKPATVPADAGKAQEVK